MISFKFEFISQIKSNVKAKDAQDSFAPDDIANNIQKNLDGPFESRFVFYLGNMTFIALVGLKKTTSREVVLEKTNFIIEELSKIAGSKLMITGAVSKFYFEASDCGTAYEDIKICNAFRCINANNTVIDYEKISFVSDVYLPSDYAEKLSNNIFSGNIKESKAIIDQIIENNVGNRINYIKMEGVLRSIFDNIINTCHSLGYSKEYISNLELGFFNQVKSISNFEDMQKFLYTIIEQVATDINIKKQSKLNKTYLLEYINLHYAEDLCLESMALMADTSPKYFSNYFKKAIGTNFVEYLSKVRINHAKELLKNSKMPVNEIGEKVGFHINGTFTYTFKKYYGVSPNEYRKTINEYK
jgi:Response regulator containing CheY-like receiver domain and AraC-type DNA-binding domain